MNNANQFDCIIIGTGGVGSATFYHAAKRGLNVLAIDQFAAAHALGSSHGQSRIIRQGYFEHPDYVPLVLDSYDLWNEVEADSGEQLKFETGLLEIGAPDSVLISGISTSAAAHDIEVERFDEQEAKVRFPLFNIPEGFVAIFEKQAGFLAVEKCVATHIRRAEELNGNYLPNCTVRNIEAVGNKVKVQTTQNDFFTERLVIASGAWTSQLLPELTTRIRVVAKHQHWFQAPGPEWNIKNGAPLFFYDFGGEYFYGFPAIDDRGVKLAEHSGRIPVDDPGQLNREIDELDESRIKNFVRQNLWKDDLVRTDHSVCMYSLTPDEHFIVDWHPTLPRTMIAAGMSGHGFKFTPKIGKYLVDQIVDDVSPSDETTFNFLRMSRLN